MRKLSHGWISVAAVVMACTPAPDNVQVDSTRESLTSAGWIDVTTNLDPATTPVYEGDAPMKFDFLLDMRKGDRRTLSLFSRMEAAALPSYLSGLVIGEELRAQGLKGSAAPVVVIGSPALAARYRLALELQGIASQTVGAEATWRGLWSIARQLKEFA